MNVTKASSPKAFRGSPLARVWGSSVLGIIVLTYLILITYSQLGEFASRVALRLGIIWIVGLIALGILVRGWRKAKTQLDQQRHGDGK